MTNTDNNSSLKIEQSTAEITTIDQLAQSLAGHTRLISDEIIMPALKQSKDYKPIIEFFHSVKKHLIHRPDEPEPKGPGLSGKFQRGWHPRPNKNSKFQCSKSQTKARKFLSNCDFLFWSFVFWSFEFVSNFDIGLCAISDLLIIRVSLCTFVAKKNPKKGEKT